MRSIAWGSRLALFVGLAFFWSMVSLRLSEDPPTIDEKAAEFLTDTDRVWQIENLYYAVAERSSDVVSADQGAAIHNAYNVLPAADADFRVLALGDSYTYGFGLTDRGVAWPAQLERMLRAEGYDATVTSIARPGASLFTYSSWVEEFVACSCIPGEPETLNLGSFDVVLIGFFNNDFHPSPGDAIVESTGREIDPSDLNGPSPFEEYVPAAAARLVQQTGRPVYWMPLAGIGANDTSADSWRWQPDRWWDLLSASGMLRVSNDAALAALGAYEFTDLMANPNDYHPSSILHHAYALDALDALREPARSAGHTSPESTLLAGRKLVYDTLPAITVDTRRGETRVSYQPDPRWLCRNDDEPVSGGISRKRQVTLSGLSIEDVACDSDGSLIVHLTSGEKFTVPHQPCAVLGRPYVEIFVSPYVPEGSAIRLAFEGVTVRPVTYASDGKRHIEEPVPTGSLVPTGRLRSLMVSGPGGEGCGADRSPVGAFDIVLENRD